MLQKKQLSILFRLHSNKKEDGFGIDAKTVFFLQRPTSRVFS